MHSEKPEFTKAFMPHSLVTVCYHKGHSGCAYDHKGEFFFFVSGDFRDYEAVAWLANELGVPNPKPPGT